ncbi:vitamin K epoxide reductase family protein [Cyclobacterium marinum]|uniref:vitamin K epoxide reductase family protein n=1 Tax=Cyclobacterium marinum TaxID=104 RepID=UPI0011EDED4A|nr:vitamin K epoxide reductase family protein [Cyclobacterium marinum]MBI0398111.1 vitamin K epoxide reductase [Cyclobacterium marinum]
MKENDPSSMSQQGDEDKSSKKIQYTCSMHPEVVSDLPGKCSKCGMTLVKKEEAKNEMPAHKMEGMGTRGVTRPMMDMEKHKMHGNERMDMAMSAMKMSTDDRMKMLKDHHKQTLWAFWAVVLLGFWMVASPVTFDYGKNVVQPSGGRDVWLSLSDRIAAMYWSDIISGILLVFFGWRSLKPNRPYSVWICCFIGIWISMAPFIFWAPTAVAYYNGTMVGALIIALTILIPGMPNMIRFMKMGGDVPTGWSYNPSSWPQRSIIIGLAFLGWLASRYLGAYQLGYIDYAWDPFFGDGTMSVLDSDMSHSFPVSDAALGTLAYTLEFLMGYMGGTSRWRTMPWMVTLFGILVIPLGFVSIFLIVSQPLSVGAWCSICLFSAIVMLPMIPLQIDEVIAMWQHMVQRKQKGDSLWKVFWKGGEAVSTETDHRSPEMAEFNERPWVVFKSSIWGMSFPWMLTISTVLGIWLMASPTVFGIGIETPFADLNHLGGALAIVFAVMAMAEVLRSLRYLNVLLGLILAVMPWFIEDVNIVFTLSTSLTGLLIMVLSFAKGEITEKYGLWDKYVV